MSVELLFHSFWAAMVIVAAGAWLLWRGNRRTDKGMMRIGAAVAVLGVLLGVVVYLFPTERERMVRRTEDIVAAVDKNDWAKLSSLLDPKTVVQTVSEDRALGRASIVDTARAEVKAFQVHHVSVLSTSATQTQDAITIVARINCTSGEFFDRPFPIQCQFEYEKSGGAWVLDRIVLLRLGDENGDDVNFHVRR